MENDNITKELLHKLAAYTTDIGSDQFEFNVSTFFSNPDFVKSFIQICSAESKPKDPQYTYTKPGGPQNIEFRPIELTQEYAKKFQVEHTKDFIQIYKDGLLVTKDIFREGGFGGRWKDGYMELIKYTEALFDLNIIKHSSNKNRKYLKGSHCVIDSNGDVKFVSSDHVQLNDAAVHLGGDIFIHKKRVFNMKTGKTYTNCYNKDFVTDDYVFVEVNYSSIYDKENKWDGVIRISRFHSDTVKEEYYPKTKR